MQRVRRLLVVALLAAACHPAPPQNPVPPGISYGFHKAAPHSHVPARLVRMYERGLTRVAHRDAAHLTDPQKLVETISYQFSMFSRFTGCQVKQVYPKVVLRCP